MKPDQELVDKLCAKIDECNVKLSIPRTMKEFGIDEAEFLEKLSDVSSNAVSDACTGSNPRSITPEQMADLFKCCYYGTEVNI